MQLNSDSFCDSVQTWMEVIGHLWAELGFWLFSEKRVKMSAASDILEGADILTHFDRSCQYGRDAALLMQRVFYIKNCRWLLASAINLKSNFTHRIGKAQRRRLSASVDTSRTAACSKCSLVPPISTERSATAECWRVPEGDGFCSLWSWWRAELFPSQQTPGLVLPKHEKRT